MKQATITAKGFASEQNARRVLEREAEAIGENKVCVVAQNGEFYPAVLYPTAPGTNLVYLCQRRIVILGA